MKLSVSEWQTESRHKRRYPGLWLWLNFLWRLDTQRRLDSFISYRGLARDPDYQRPWVQRGRAPVMSRRWVSSSCFMYLINWFDVCSFANSLCFLLFYLFTNNFIFSSHCSLLPLLNFRLLCLFFCWQVISKTCQHAYIKCDGNVGHYQRNK